MAWDAYLHLEGIKGEATRKGHEEDIPLKSFSLGGSLPIISAPGQPLQVAGRAQLSGFHFTKRSDGASPALFNAMCNNKKFPDAKVTFYRAGSETSVPYIEYEFKNVVLADLNWSGADGGEGIPEEAGSFYFGYIKVIYTVPNPDGTKKGVLEAEYNVETVDK